MKINIIEAKWENDVFKGHFTFRSPVNLENSFGATNVSEDAESDIEVTCDLNTNHGYFEWEIEELDMYAGGGLELAGKFVEGYDGVFALPEQLISFLEGQGFNMDEVKV